MAHRLDLSLRVGRYQVEKARNWFNRSVTLNPDIGDFWAQYYKFECQHGTKQQQEDLLTKVKAIEPRHGEYWYALPCPLGQAFGSIFATSSLRPSFS
jgi:hypothetical protein